MKLPKSLLYYCPYEVNDQRSFVHDFNVSVVLPFYKKFLEFKKALRINSKYLQRAGIEVILVMDEPSQESDVINLIGQYPLINWKVIINRKAHSWRNPSKAINVGIRNASKEYILICSPESIFYTDVIYIMRKTLFFYRNHYTTGYVAFAHGYESINNINFNAPYGSIMVKKVDLMKIRGYDESLSKWGGDDDNIRIRLDMVGIKRLLNKEAKLIHWEKKVKANSQSVKHLPLSIESLRKIKYPESPYANNRTWGKDFNQLIYDWSKKEKGKTEYQT